MLAPLVLQPRTLTLWVHWVLSDGASAGLAHPRRGNHVVGGMILRRRSRGAVVKRLLGFQALRSGMAGIVGPRERDKSHGDELERAGEGESQLSHDSSPCVIVSNNSGAFEKVRRPQK